MKFEKAEPHVLAPQEILDYIKAFEAEKLPLLCEFEKYFLGDNPYIDCHGNSGDSTVPNWKCKISYGRKIINTTAGYMFKPGLITYKHKNAATNKEIQTLFRKNKEDVQTSQLGKFVSTFGYGLELFYMDGDAEPTWKNADVKEIIPILTTALDPQLWCFIRFWNQVNAARKITRYIDVYYAGEIQHFIQDEGIDRVPKIRTEPSINLFKGVVPLNIVQNNDEMIGDIEPIVKLIDAYDVLASDSMNEFDKFAQCYMLLSDGLDKEDLPKIKTLRIFENLGKEGFVKFLTKDIPITFIQFMQGWIKNEIHQQSHVPDFLEMSSGSLTSGAALDRLLFDFEFLCATKESYFKEGLYNRFKIIDSVKNVTDAELISDDIEITFTRNRPSDNLSNAQIYNQYRASGAKITEETMLQTFAPFVKDVDAEIKAYDEEQQNELETYPQLSGFENTTQTDNQNNLDNGGNNEQSGDGGSVDLQVQE